MSSLKRHFTAVVGSKEHGLYISASPSSAARKIVSKLCAASKSKKVEFCVRETTNGSKKKTYGPYLGEMKKLAKPIELKGRIIRFETEVHLKNKKIAIKTAKKIGKKMRGGGVRTTGIPSIDDFFFNREIISKMMRDRSILNVPPVTVKTNIFSREPYLFFGIINRFRRTIENSSSYGKHYFYVAYNSGFGNSKKAMFKKFNNPDNGYSMVITPEHEHIHEVHITGIQNDYLIELRDFIIQQRTELNDPTFCNTIYNAVIEQTGPPQ